VQEISEEDAVAEGVRKIAIAYQEIDWQTNKLGLRQLETYRHTFSGLWDSINEKRGYSWESNPWVWVIEFRRF